MDEPRSQAARDILTARRAVVLAELRAIDAALAAGAAPRVPRRDRLADVVAFLGTVPDATRPAIAAATGVPAGTLSKVLLDRETFEHLGRGRWRLRAGPGS